jgi:hypothetical protein
MRDGNCAAIGWSNIGDLSGLSEDPDGKEKIRKKLEEDGEAPNAASRHTNEISAFVTRIADDDVILAANGEEIVGIVIHDQSNQRASVLMTVTL